jgi:hypothetical protein
VQSSKDLEYKIRQIHPLIILGMHRSGTSLTVRLLKDLGIHMGSYLSRDAEAVHFQKINRRILRSVKSSWGEIDSLILAMDSEMFIQTQTEKALKNLFPALPRKLLNPGISDYFSSTQWEALAQDQAIWWGWKDPRTTITFPIWLRVFPKARFLYILRNGIDVAISIHRRSMKQHRKVWKRMLPLDYCPKTLDFGYCFNLWEKYVSYVNNYKELIPPDQFLEIRYEELLANPYHNLLKIADFIKYPLQETLLEAACTQIDQGRLVNTKFARPYKDKISSLVKSPWMVKLNYTYQIDL